MAYELDGGLEGDLLELAQIFINEGYEAVKTNCITTQRKNSKGKFHNAYVEPQSIEMKRGETSINIEFYLIHERQENKKRIKHINFNPQPKNLNDIISSEKLIREINRV